VGCRQTIQSTVCGSKEDYFVVILQRNRLSSRSHGTDLAGIDKTFFATTPIWETDVDSFLPRCMERRRGLAMRILSVRPSVHLSNA